MEKINRIIILADQDVGKSIVEFLIREYHSDIALIVVCDENEISELAIQANIPVLKWTTSDDLCEFLKKQFVSEKIMFGILAWWPFIIKESLIAFPTYGFINTHPSMLPYNRGKHYNFWAIVEEAPFGVSLHQVTPGIDNGDIVAQLPIVYDWLDTGETLYLKAKEAMVSLFISNYHNLRENRINRIPQPKGIGSFHLGSELDSASCIQLDKQYSGRQLLNLLRARTFYGKPACWFVDNNNETYEVRISIEKKQQ